jgi:3-methyladenine DNA glycosylase AlkD
MEKIIKQCLTDLEKQGNLERAREQQRYLKSPYKFYGVSKSLLNNWAKKIRRSNPEITQKRLLEVCKELWQSEYHDQKTLAIELLKTYPAYIDDKELPLIEKMIDESKGWDLIDNIAIWLVGELIRKNKDNHKLIEKWSTDKNFWRRRVAIISPIKLFKKNECDIGLYMRIWENHLDEKEFFIRKGIGWVLREFAKTDPDAVYKFVYNNRKQMSGLTFREASKNLPLDKKEKLMEM